MNKIELIDRVALLKTLPQICEELNGCSAPYNFDEHCVGCEVYMLHKMLTDIPTIDAAPVRRGEWKGRHGDKMIAEDTYRHYHYYICNLCYKRTAVRSNFCPNCGADMRGVSE